MFKGLLNIYKHLQCLLGPATFILSKLKPLKLPLILQGYDFQYGFCTFFGEGEKIT